VKLVLIFIAMLSAGFARELPDVDCASVLHLLADAGRLESLRWPDFSDYTMQIQNFYEPAGYEPAWIRGGAPTLQAEALIEILLEADLKGLDPEDYDASHWAERLNRLREEAQAEDLADFDLALTVSVMRYVSDLHLGKVNPGLYGKGFDLENERYDLASLIRKRVVDTGDVRAALRGLEPPYPGYQWTQDALRRYLELAHQDDGEPLPATAKPIEPGNVYQGVVRLTRLLRLLGDLPAAAAVPADSDLYTGPLVDAVKHFQMRHGLDADGRIGKTTLAALNTPLSQRVRQLQLTLERWRWVPHAFDRPPIVVNIPEFRLRAFNDSYRTTLEMKVVVGKAYGLQTPVFADEMTRVIFRPYWNVPVSIERKELVPKIERDPLYFEKNDFEVVTPQDKVVATGVIGDEILDRLRSGDLRVRQVPGPKNSLGLVKFLFPNPYDVYLHDTPATELFSKSRRDFSHGCIRVEKPVPLAEWVLRDNPEWTHDRILEAMNGSKTIEVELAHPIPVLIVYATAVVLENGEAHFFNDIYGLDASLEALLAHGYPYPEWKPTSGVRVPRPHE